MSKMIVILTLMMMTNIGRTESREEIMENQKLYIDKMAHNLQESAVWLIEHGVETHREQGKAGIFRKLLNRWGVQQWVDPVIGGRYLTLFRIKARQMNADIQCLTRIIDDNVFEYWLIQFSGPEWKKSSVGTEYCLFVITQADDIEGVRKIIHQGKSFFPSYKVNERITVSLPLDDLRLQYDMMAWEFPESYPDSDLKNWEVGIDEHGNFVRVPINQH